MVRVLLGLGLFAALFGIFTLAETLVHAEGYMSAARYRDVTLLYAMVPAYFLAISGRVVARRGNALSALEVLVQDESARAAAAPAKPWFWPLLLGAAGAVFGLLDYPTWRVPAEQLAATVTLGLGNGLVWLSVGWFFGWALTNARTLSRLGSRARVDVFDLRPLKPVAAVASLNVFVTMGALALMPIQSLSSPFHYEYYVNGFVFGIPSAIALFVLPQWGLRAKLREAKTQALAHLADQIAAVRSDEPAVLETLLAHRDRISSTREWPVDHRVFSRAMLYLVVPPLAWVGAAIVERGVDQLF